MPAGAIWILGTQPRFSGSLATGMQLASSIKVGEECAWQKCGEIHQEGFKLTPEREGDDHYRDFNEGVQTAEAHLGRSGQMECGASGTYVPMLKAWVIRKSLSF